MDYDWITERIALGAKLDSLYDARKLKADGLTHVLNVCEDNEEEDAVGKSGLGYANFSEPDDRKEKPASWYGKSLAFAWQALSDPKAKLYVHCLQGWHRSPSIVYALLRSFGLSKKKARKLVLKGREDAEETYFDDADKAIEKLGYAG